MQVTIGGAAKAGWFQWDGERRQPGWQMQFDVDLTGRIFGSSRNDTAGAERDSRREMERAFGRHVKGRT